MRRDRDDAAHGTDGAARDEISRWEWLTAAVGLLLVVGTIGFMSYEAATGGDSPPVIEVAVDSVRRVPGGHVVHFTARNLGDRAGAQVVVEGRVAREGGEPATSQTTLDYVPGQSERGGGLFFPVEPAADRLTLQALGYVRP